MDDLAAAFLGHPEIWTYSPYGPYADRDGIASYVAASRGDPHVPFVVVVDGRAVGVECLMRIDEVQGVVEVGAIVLGPSLQRTTASTEAAYLLARHVFDDLGYRRYEWKCDSLNAPSRAAAARLGFRYEGRFRQALVYKGRNRDTDWFSITDAEWPALGPASRPGWTLRTSGPWRRPARAARGPAFLSPGGQPNSAWPTYSPGRTPGRHRPQPGAGVGEVLHQPVLLESRVCIGMYCRAGSRTKARKNRPGVEAPEPVRAVGEVVAPAQHPGAAVLVGVRQPDVRADRQRG